MNRYAIVSLLVVAAILSGWVMVGGRIGGEPDRGPAGGAHAEEQAAEFPEGPHGGKLFEADGFAVELVLYETGVPPEYHAYGYRAGEPLAPDAFDLEVELTRVDGQVDRFEFKPLADYLRGQGVVTEPHSFDVAVRALHAGNTYQWSFSSYEGRTTIPGELAREAGIETEAAGPAMIPMTLSLTGTVQPDPSRITRIRARFPGVVQEVSAAEGETVEAGRALARVQSNESLRTYTVTAPMSGVLLEQNAQPGMVTAEAPLFVIANLSRVWIDLDVFARHIGKVKPGQSVAVSTLDGEKLAGKIDWVSPVARQASQSVRARVILDNAARKLRPGQFVRAEVTVEEHPADLAVRESAIQRFRDFQVVFAKFGNTYEVRMLELGRRNGEWAEVLGGLKPGSEYVTGNSYLIKADVEKSGASHDH